VYYKRNSRETKIKPSDFLTISRLKRIKDIIEHNREVIVELKIEK